MKQVKPVQLDRKVKPEPLVLSVKPDRLVQPVLKVKQEPKVKQVREGQLARLAQVHKAQPVQLVLELLVLPEQLVIVV